MYISLVDQPTLGCSGTEGCHSQSIHCRRRSACRSGTCRYNILCQRQSQAQQYAPGCYKKPKRDWSTWRPDTKRAMWLAIVLPGAGQIYNRKYWKLPIIYGGFVGCAYAITWNNQMYHDYSQAYMDIMDDDPTTDSYNQFLHLGATIDASNMDRYKEIFRKRKDRYRRWRDMGVFVMIGVYAFSIIDAYVDASLSEFDISDDLTLRVEPAFMNSNPQSRNPFRSGTLGLQCSLTF